MKIKVGFGLDVHQLAEGLDFWLGGILIPHSKGCVAHSDGDVLIHAICDALLGAANMRDIGFHFPDNSNIYKNIDSKILLSKTVEIIETKSFVVGNIDCTVCLQKPKIMGYVPDMQTVIASLLKIDIDDVSIKATTTEKLGFEGREEGVSAYCTALIYKNLENFDS